MKIKPNVMHKFTIADCSAKLGNVGKAILIYDSILVKPQKVPLAVEHYADMLYESGLVKKATRELEKYVDSEMRKDQIYRRLGWNYKVMNNRTKAIQYYELCFKENPKFEYCRKEANKLKYGG